MRGYFGIGADRISKAANVGALMRTAHAFGASFIFTVNETYKRQALDSVDTSGATGNLPYYRFEDAEALMLPRGCTLVGVEITDDAVELPSFHHPKCAAYVMGRSVVNSTRRWSRGAITWCESQPSSRLMSAWPGPW